MLTFLVIITLCQKRLCCRTVDWR